LFKLQRIVQRPLIAKLTAAAGREPRNAKLKTALMQARAEQMIFFENSTTAPFLVQQASVGEYGLFDDQIQLQVAMSPDAALAAAVSVTTKSGYSLSKDRHKHIWLWSLKCGPIANPISLLKGHSDAVMTVLMI
jgi:hypothetical protein